MNVKKYIEMVPVYYARMPDGRMVPFIVSLLLYDVHRSPRITPAVESSINRTIDITGRNGLAISTVADDVAFSVVAARHLERAMGIPGAIVLFRCQFPETAERLMQYLSAKYTLSLVREGDAPCNLVQPTAR